jgi:hypothetical protein
VTKLILKRALASRPSGQWSEDDYDVLADGIVVGRIMKATRCAGGNAVDVDARLRPSRGSHADSRLRSSARGRDGGVCEELAAGGAAPSEGHSRLSPLSPEDTANEYGATWSLMRRNMVACACASISLRSRSQVS